MPGGTPVELGAAGRQPYAGTQTKGRRNSGGEESETLLRESIGRDDQPVLHVVGDATAETVLDAMAAIAPAEDWRPRRLRFEHGDGLRAHLLARVRAYGGIVMQHPAHRPIPSPLPAASLHSGPLHGRRPTRKSA